MKIGFLHKEGRMKYVYEMTEKEHEVEICNHECFDYDVIVMGMAYFDEKSFGKEYVSLVNPNVVFVCYDALESLKNKFSIVCLRTCEEFLLKNAKVTAWGILGILLDNCEECLTDITIDVIGYGRCGKAIVQLLDALGVKCRVIVKEVKEYPREVIHFEEYVFKKPSQWIIQTADMCIFDSNWAKRNNICSIIDITSNFVGTMHIQKEDISIYYAKALPDHYCMKSSAKIYYEILQEVLL